MEYAPLTAISSVDGRYARHTEALRDFFSEYGLIRYRVQVELAWFQALAGQPEMPEFPALSTDANTLIEALLADFDIGDAQRVKEIERQTNHDVKAVELLLKERFDQHPELRSLSGFLHFACTSEDINNLAYALLIRDARDSVLVPLHAQIDNRLLRLTAELAELPMVSRTHGQIASPTTLGKELANFLARLRRQSEQIADLAPLGKFNGAAGNFNAHMVSNPDLDWPDISRRFVQ
ncbi:MAG TPA: lyase family protein, partial [Xanthomonadales bacterium]|nr:lyase family protein [Xanthomonadales bacterium]